MEVIPAVDILNGRCVQLSQGDYTKSTEYNSNPLAAALEWQQEGATRLHVVDLDGAREGWPVNAAIVRRLAAELTIPVQVGGGVRTEADARGYVEAGLSRVILGTSAVEDMALVQRLVSALRAALVVGVDARDGVVMTRGWLQSGEVRTLDLARALVAVGVTRFIYTDIARDGMLQGPNISALQQFISAAECPVVASGGFTSVEHLVEAADAGAEAAIVGTALYQHRFTLAEAHDALVLHARPA